MNDEAHVCSEFRSPSPLSPYTLTPVLFSTSLRYTASENNIRTKHRSPKKKPLLNLKPPHCHSFGAYLSLPYFNALFTFWVFNSH